MRSGHAKVTLAGKAWPLDPGVALLMRPVHQRTLFQSKSWTEFWALGFEATLFAQMDFLQSLQEPALWRPSPEEFAVLENMLAQQAALSIPIEKGLSLDGAAQLVLQGLGRAVLGLCWQQLEARQLVTEPALQTAAWLPFALGHLRQKPDVAVAQWARSVGFSPAQFRRVFQACTGLSPQNYQTRYRINQARTLLRTTDLPVAAVAEQLGYRSQSNFLLHFKRATGQTPSQYRQELATAKDHPY
jgi:AraC-like DNA-binding protein